MNMRAWINAVIAKCLWLAQQLYSGSLPQMSTFSLHWLSTSLTPKQSQRLGPLSHIIIYIVIKG